MNPFKEVLVFDRIKSVLRIYSHLCLHAIYIEIVTNLEI